MLKKVLLRLLCVVTLLSFVMPVYASNSTSAFAVPNETLAGTGSLNDPYQISDCLDLGSLNQSRYSGSVHNGFSYVLTNDIDCSDTVNWYDGQGFSAVGMGALYTEWNGIGPITEQYFDGNNHTISGLTSHVDAADSAMMLFKMTGFGATIKNLKIENATLIDTGATSRYHAILVGVNYGTIQNVHVNGQIVGAGSAGLLAAGNIGVIRESSASGTITSNNGSNENVGGLVGLMPTIPSGFSVPVPKVINSFSDVNISTTANATGVKCGGLVGADGVFVEGNVNGIASIENSYALGNVNCSLSTNSKAGGLVGSISQPNVSVINSFSKGTVSSGSGGSSGGLVGENTLNKTFANSFYDVTSSGQSVCSPAPNAAACAGVNSANSQANYFVNNSTNQPFDTWDFENVWAVNSTYPIFKASVSTPTAVTNLAGTPALDAVELTWTAPSGPVGVPIIDYFIDYRQANTSTWNTFTDAVSNSTTATVTGLSSGTDYEFRVRASNVAGNSIPSNVLTVTTLSPAGTSEIAYRGDGSAENPFQISTCEELQNLNDEIYAYDVNDPDNYILTNDIDCSDSINWNDGLGFIPIRDVLNSPIESYISPIHEQYFDGRNHTISGLYIANAQDSIGLFGIVGALSTVKNLKIVGETISHNTITSYLGGAVGYNKGIIDNVSVDATITSNVAINMTSTGSLGGVVGYNAGTITRSFSKGLINITASATGSLGGIAGTTVMGSIDNSYSEMNINDANGVGIGTCGGLVGNVLQSTINHSYSTGAVYCARSSSVSGSLAGDVGSTSTISNSFGTGMVGVLGGEWHNGFVGRATTNKTFANSFFDVSNTTHFYCAANSINGCIGKNAFFNDIYYFNNNSTNAPLNSWDFVNTWRTTNIYPILNNVPTVPFRPENLLGITTLTTADLTWSAPTDTGGAAITDYEVQYKKATDSSWTVFNDGVSSATNATITGLTQGELYKYRVRAINSAGSGIYSFARTEIQLQTKIDSPVLTEFEYGDEIEYEVSVYNTSSNPIDSIDTSFLSSSFNIDSITTTTGELGSAPSDLGSVTNGTAWTGLLEGSQELVFKVRGTVNALPNETGQLTFAGAQISYQGVALDLGEEANGMIQAESTAFVVKETATDFSISTSLRESGLIDNGDSVHLKYSIKNHGPKAGFFTNSSVFIFVPPSINVTQIENDFLVCSDTVLIDSNLNTGIYANMQGQVFTQCVGTGGKISNVNETITIDITGIATRDFNAGDVVSRAMFIAAQDQDTIALGDALNSSPSSADTVFTSNSNNVSRLVYSVNRPSSQVTTTTTLPDSNNPSTPATPSSKDSITTNKSGSSNGKVTIKNKIIESTSSSTSKVSTGDASSAFESIPEIKSFLEESNKAVKESEKKSALAKYKSKQSSPFELFWLAGVVMMCLLTIGARQTLIIRKAAKKLKS